MQNKSFKVIGNVGGGIKRFSLFSLVLCSALYSTEFTYNGIDDKGYLSDNGTFILPGTNGNKLTFDYSPGVKTVKNVQVTTENNENVYDNIFTINNGKITEFIYGAITSKGEAYNNKLIIKNGELEAAMAGFSNYSDAHDNYVLVTGGIIGDAVFGANISGVNTNKAYRNTVEVRDGNINSVVGAATFAVGQNGGDIYNNKVLNF